MIAQAISPYTEVEVLSDGVTIYHNKDGSMTAVVEMTDEQIEAMSAEDDADRLVDKGDYLEGADGTVDVRIEEELTEDNTLVTVKDDGSSIAFYPVLDTVDNDASDNLSNSAETPADHSEPPSAEQTESQPTETASAEEPASQETTPPSSEDNGQIEDTSNQEVLQNEPPSENPEPTTGEASAPSQAPPAASAPQESDDVPDDVPEKEINIDANKQGYSRGAYDSALFEDVFDAGIDIEFSALKKGVKENIIINEYAACYSFSYMLKVSGLTPEQSGSSILFKDGDGEIAANMAAPFMQDSGGSYSEDITVELQKLGGGLYQIIYTPSDAWLSSKERQYPVTIDPTVTYTSSDTYGIEDNYVSSSAPNTVLDYNATTIRAGSYGSTEQIAYIRPVIPDSLRNVMDNVLIRSASLSMYESSGKTGGSSYSLHQVTGGEWNSRTLTYNNRPSYNPAACDTKNINGSGIVTWNITSVFSTWFNALDQKPNYGLALVADGNASSNYRIFHSADTPSNRMTYSVTYFEAPSDPGLNLAAYGNGVNSGSGYVNLSWNAVDGADKYYVGVFNGGVYEYFDVGGATSWSTHNSKIWPTPAEISSGRYALHHDGAGTELPMIPAATYSHYPGSTYGNSLVYYFKVIPVNIYGQVPNPGRFSQPGIVLPDTLPPSQPTNVSVSPSTYTNAGSISVSWSGVTDYNNTSGSASSSLGTGRIQYNINGSGWQNTSSNSGTGTYSFSTSGLGDGSHVVYIRGVDSAGNEGAYRGANFYIDKSGPTAPTLSVTPSSWTKDSLVSITWSGISDHNPLNRVEYSIDGGAWVSTGRADNAFSGYGISIASLASGSHTIGFRGIDAVGNVGTSRSITVYKDVLAPVITQVDVIPPSWTTNDTIDIAWTGLVDAHSGMKVVSYELDGAAAVDLSPVAADDSFTIHADALADGEHTVAIDFVDQLDNTLSRTVKFYRDATKPDISILSPADGDIVNGMLEIWGSVDDISLDEWKVTAEGSDGIPVVVTSGSTAQSNALLGLLNTSTFADGETIEISLEAKDKAGNVNTVDGIFVKVDKSAKPVASEVSIVSPENGAFVATATVTGLFDTTYSDNHEKGYFYIDSVYQNNTDGKSFPFDAITYPDLSSHTISVISEDEHGVLHYSKGLGAFLTLSDTFADDSFTASKTGIVYSAFGAKLDGALTGTIISSEVTSPKNILALRLNTSEATPTGTSIEYFYSLDNGTTWTQIEPGKDVPITEPAKKVTIKSVLTGNGVDSPVLYGMDLESIFEMSPSRVSVKLLRDAESFEITQSNPINHATTTFSTSEITAQNKWLFSDGQLHSDSFTYNALTTLERLSHAYVLLAENESHEMLGSGSVKNEILLRENVNRMGTVESGIISFSSPVYAIRFDALTDGAAGDYYYSLDAVNWTHIEADKNTALEQSTTHIYLKAQMGSATLRAWHLEGMSASAKTYKVQLLVPPAGVVAADWGEYYDNEKLKKYELSWTDPNITDESERYATHYEIHRDGEFLAQTDELQYTDMDYHAGAVYTVSVVREYDAPAVYPVRQSLYTQADIAEVAEEQRIEGVNHDIEEYAQSEYLNELYGGNYTFSDSNEAPTGEVELDQKLLGKSKHCAIGFEPVNFNSGNFFLNAQDFYLAGKGEAVINITRTYNTQSSVFNGPFGSGWEFAYSSRLVLYKNGDVGYRMVNGSQVNFRLQKDGTYEGSDDYGLKFATNDLKTEYIVTEMSGTQIAFGSGGLLKYIKYSDGNVVTIERNKDGLMTAIVLPTGKALLVSMDGNGHIKSTTTPKGTVISYGYSGNNLTAVTDGNGNTTKYVYDAKGRMTAWYDGNGIKQVVNKYDSEDRVIWQADANGGEYTLKYEPDCTITTDAEGNRKEIWFDSLRRTIKEVDAKGNETLSFYDDEGNLSGTTDAFGNLTVFEYDARGNKTKQTAPDGSVVLMEYDLNNNMTKLTDQLGSVTEYEYDEKHNLIKQTNADGSLQSFEYDENGQVVKKVDAKGNAVTFEYDEDLLVKSTDALGHETTYDYDADGRMTSATDAFGVATHYEYDNKGNLVKQTFADDTFVTIEYDALGNKTKMTDAKGQATTFTYDGLYNLITTTLPDGTKTTAAYSPNMQMTQATNALGNAVSYTYDANGNATTVTDAMGNVLSYEYDEMNRVVKETLPTGAARVYEYDALTGLLAASIDENGAETTYVYDAAGRMTAQHLANGGVIKSEYDSMGRLVKQISVNGAETLMTYDMNGSLQTTTNPLGGVTAYTYDANGNVLTVTDPLGGVTAYTYDALGRTAELTDANGGVTTYEYDDKGNLVKTTDALGHSETYEYDANGSLTKQTDKNGAAVSFDYNELGALIKTVQKNGGSAVNEYDAAGNIVAATDVLGAKTAYEYNPNGLAVKVTDALGRTSAMEYDALGNITKITAADGSVVLYAYTASGRARSVTDELGTQTTYKYDKMGNVTASTTNGATTTYTYDYAGNVLSTTDAEGRTVQFKYDKMGSLVRTTYPDGSCSMTEYDVMGRVTKEIPRSGIATEYEYDALGNVTAVINGERTTSYEYDLLGRLIKTTYPDGTTGTFAYDALGNMTTETDALGHSTQYDYDVQSLLTAVKYANSAKQTMDYDLAGKVLSETDAEGHTQSYRYDAAGRMTGVTDALGYETAYTYDVKDNLKKVTDANGHADTFTYDAKGNMTSETDALGNTVKYAYTPEGWLEAIAKADGKLIAFDYDKTGNLTREDYAGELTTDNTYNDLGMLTVAKSAEGETKYQYDNKGFLISVTNPGGDVVQYTYDAYGRKETMTYPDGRTVKYAYDSMDRMVKVTGLDGRDTAYSYDANGQRIQSADGTLTTEYSYDNVGNLINQQTTGRASLSFEYGYDLNGNITAETRTESGAAVQSAYAYDARGELTDATKSDGFTESYVYDAAGNMTQKLTGGVNIDMTYNAANQLASMQSENGTIAYSYDQNGNLISKALGDKTDTYTYDAMDQLTAYTGYDGYKQRYTYNAQGMRSAKEVSGDSARYTLEEIISGKGAFSEDEQEADPADEWVKTSYIYDVTMPYYEVISEETDGKLTSYDYGIERISAIFKNGLYDYKTAYVYDGRGSVAQEVTYNAAWSVLGSWLMPVTTHSKSYSPFGEMLEEKVSGYGFNGERYDMATGMINLRARQYEPAMMRFAQKDTVKGKVKEPLTQNLYPYCENDPVNLIDPSGRSSVSEMQKKINETQRKINELESRKKWLNSSASAYMPKNAVTYNQKKQIPSINTQLSALKRNIQSYYVELGQLKQQARIPKIVNNGVEKGGDPYLFYDPLSDNYGEKDTRVWVTVSEGTAYNIKIKPIEALINTSGEGTLEEEKTRDSISDKAFIRTPGATPSFGIVDAVDTKTHAILGGLTLAQSLIDSSLCRTDITIMLQESGDDKRAVVSLYSTDRQKQYKNIVGVNSLYSCSGGMGWAASGAVEQLYKDLTGNETGPFDMYDLQLTIDPQHVDNPVYANIIGVNGDDLHLRPTVYDKDHLAVGQLTWLNLGFDEKVDLTGLLDGSEWTQGGRDILEQALLNMGEK